MGGTEYPVGHKVGAEGSWMCLAIVWSYWKEKRKGSIRGQGKRLWVCVVGAFRSHCTTVLKTNKQTACRGRMLPWRMGKGRKEHKISLRSWGNDQEFQDEVSWRLQIGKASQTHQRTAGRRRVDESFRKHHDPQRFVKFKGIQLWQYG